MSGLVSAEVYLSSFGQSLGERRDVRSLGDTHNREVVEELYAEGHRYYRASSVEPVVLAARSAQETLQRWGKPIDLIIYCAVLHSLDERSMAPPEFLEQIDAERTPVLGVGLNGCANAGSGLHVASAMVASGMATSVLLVTSDVDLENNRLSVANAGVLSDGAASCVVSAQRPPSGFRVRDVELVTDARLVRFEPDEPVAAAKYTMKALASAARSIYDRGSLKPDEIRTLVTNNYRKPVTRQYAWAAQVADEAIYTASAPDVGHCFAADPLLNLALLEQEGLPPSAVLVLFSALNSWAWLALEQLG